MRLRMTFWTPAVAYAGFLLGGGGNVPNKMGMMVTTGFMGALLGFLLAIMFTLRELRRERASHPRLSGLVLRH
jgi:drug/metabolite transporter (DMT)-like permease